MTVAPGRTSTRLQVWRHSLGVELERLSRRLRLEARFGE